MNKIIQLSRTYWYMPVSLLLAITLWMGCTPEKGGGLGALPTAAFSVQGGGSSNQVILTNTAPGTVSYWTVPGHGTVSGQTDTVSFTFSGTYTVSQMVAGNGGIDSTSQQVTINQNNPTACVTGMQGYIAGCTQKTWMLDPVAGGEGIGPAPNNITWWGNGAGEPTGDRVCDFNDTYTFSFNAVGTFVYNNQGDFYTENYLGNANNDCDVNADLSVVDQPWASGTFNYEYIPNAGSNPSLGQLKVVGLGAHIGLPRVENGSDLSTDLPVNAVTYDIVDTATDASGHQLMSLSINGTGGDWWTWVLRAN